MLAIWSKIVVLLNSSVVTIMLSVISIVQRSLIYICVQPGLSLLLLE